MKTHLILAATLAASLTAVRAQEGVSAPPPAAAESPAGEAPRTDPAPAPAPTSDEPLSLIPSEPQAAPLPAGSEEPLPAAAPGSEADAPVKISKPAPLKKGTAEELRQAIRIRELKTRVLKSPAVQAQYTQATLARTPAGHRAALRNYYTLISDGIVKLDPALKEPVERKLVEELRSLEQRRVRPSVLIEPIAELPGSHSSDHQKRAAAPAETKADKTGSSRPSSGEEDETSDSMGN